MTELRHSEETLRENEVRYHAIFNAAAVSLWDEDFSRVESAIEEVKARGVTDFRTWLDSYPEFVSETIALIRVADVNNETLKLCEAATKEELLGSLGRVFTPEYFLAFKEILVAIAEGKTYVEAETIIRTVQGTPRHIQIRANIPCEKSRFTNLLVSMIDLSARKEAVAEIEILHTNLAARAAELEAANRELAAFSYSLSHDLRNPLTRICASVAALEEEHALHIDATGRRHLDWIEKSSKRIELTLEAMLMLARVSRSEILQEDVDLSSLAREIALDLRLSRPDRNVEFTISSNVHVRGDPKLLYVALENLLGNAWKFTGKLPEARIEFGMSGDGEKMCYVRDNGAGFVMKNADRLFQPFQRLHLEREFEGLGIGLATAQRVILRHGGKIWAMGEPDRGATFFFTLPGISRTD